MSKIDEKKQTAPLFISPHEHVKHIDSLCYKDSFLYMDDLKINDIVEKFDTPAYVYSAKSILNSFKNYDNNFSEIPHQICYAVKANSNLAILQLLAQHGAGFDIVSGGELARVLKSGGDPRKIVFSGLGKSRLDIKNALSCGIACFNVESEVELHRINEVATEMNLTAPISIRVNPNIEAKTHPYISTGLKENKFGIQYDQVIELYKTASNLKNINPIGIDCHLGSQITDIDPFISALDKLLIIKKELDEYGIKLHHINLGGGIGVQYIYENTVNIQSYANLIKKKLEGQDLKLYLEPGRSIVANAGVLLTKVDILKPTTYKNFAVVDAAMNDLIRPTLYQSEMGIIPTQLTEEIPKIWDIVGSICETGDFLAKERKISLAEDTILAITSAGAYSFVMSSNYNTRPRACEILVEDRDAKIIRKREEIEKLWENEILS